MIADPKREGLRRAADELRIAHGEALGALDARVDQLDRSAERAQQQSASLAGKYAAFSQRLGTGRVADANVRLPKKVRPMSGQVSVRSAVQRQNAAEGALSSAIDAYEGATAATDSPDTVTEDTAALTHKGAKAPHLPAVARHLSAGRWSGPHTRARVSVKLYRRLLWAWMLAVILSALVGTLIMGLGSGTAAGAAAALAVSCCWVFVKGVAFSTGESIRKDAGAPLAASAFQRTGEFVSRASELGEVTGYEPEPLRRIQISRPRLMHGDPGSGLAGAGFGVGATQAGQVGEKNFAKALSKANLLERFATFWSLHMLAQDTYGRQESDIDCAIVSGQTIWLIDVKNYASGNVYYRSCGQWLQIIDAATGKQVGEPRKMSRNMEVGVKRFKSRYHNYKTFGLQARVVFMPTPRGAGRVDGVEWPGQIPARTLTDLLLELEGEPPFEESLEAELVVRTFKGLLKG